MQIHKLHLQKISAVLFSFDTDDLFYVLHCVNGKKKKKKKTVLCVKSERKAQIWVSSLVMLGTSVINEVTFIWSWIVWLPCSCQMLYSIFNACTLFFIWVLVSFCMGHLGWILLELPSWVFAWNLFIAHFYFNKHSF